MRLTFALILALAACGGASSSQPGGAKLGPRQDLGCTPSAPEDEAACRYRGKDCSFGPPLECRGTPPTPAQEESWRRALANATLPCACTCEEDRVACRTRP